MVVTPHARVSFARDSAVCETVLAPASFAQRRPHVRRRAPRRNLGAACVIVVPGMSKVRRSSDGPRRPTLEAFTLAVGPGGVHVVFQPIVDLSTQSVFAVETLARCRVAGFESPVRLFEDAVEKGYCGRLGRVIREMMVAGAPPLPVFANVHPEELVQRWIARDDDPLFTHTHDVYLEITESVPFSHFDHCLSVLREIQATGRVHLVIDDLGAGYSNLLRIVDLEPAIVKLDMQLIRRIDTQPRQQALVRSIVSMCADQGARVVAEGIETKAELDAVIDAGVHYGQGYLFARPGLPIPPVVWPK
jgi:EAL domain-containing protein (putative c-di-GMP-specific phosphodiesterase class I)